VAPDGVTFVTTNLLIRDARESSEVEASWEQFSTVIENLIKTRVDYITLSGAPLVLAKGVERHRELLNDLRRQSPVPADTSPQAFADGLKYLGATKLAVATSFIPAYNELVKQFLVSEGFEVLGIETLDTGLTSLEKATLSPLQVYQHVRAVGRRYPNCDAILITSAAWPTLTMIQPLEDDLGKPVVSSSVGQIWNPLHELGIRTRITGYGTLLRTLAREK
jgi:maleate cis-trans isomerase